MQLYSSLCVVFQKWPMHILRMHPRDMDLPDDECLLVGCVQLEMFFITLPIVWVLASYRNVFWKKQLFVSHSSTIKWSMVKCLSKEGVMEKANSVSYYDHSLSVFAAIKRST